MCLIGRYDRMVYYPRFLDSMGAGDDHTSLFPERTRTHTFVFSVGAPTRRVLNVRDVCGTLPVSTAICRYSIHNLSTNTNGCCCCLSLAGMGPFAHVAGSSCIMR